MSWRFRLPGTYNWDTTGLPAGTYQLKCWAVSAEGIESSTYATVTIYLAVAVLDVPAAGSSHVAGTMTITGRAYLVGSGSVRLQVEIDTHDPPDDESEDYDLITSALVDQGEAVSVIGNPRTCISGSGRDETPVSGERLTDVRAKYVLRGPPSPPCGVVRTLAVYNRSMRSPKALIRPSGATTNCQPIYAESPRGTGGGAEGATRRC